jgi:hypothetical protein
MVSQQRPQQEDHVVAQATGGKPLCLIYEYWVRPRRADAAATDGVPKPTGAVVGTVAFSSTRHGGS